MYELLIHMEMFCLLGLKLLWAGIGSAYKKKSKWMRVIIAALKCLKEFLLFVKGTCLVCSIWVYQTVIKGLFILYENLLREI